MRLSTNYFRLKITICLLFVFIFVFNNCYSLTMPTEFDEESSINSGSKEIEKEIDELVDIYREKSNGIISGDAWPSAIFISLLKEINDLIDNFDAELCALKSERCNVSFYQKLGEYELILRHKELNKLRAFDKEDKKFCDRLIKMYEEYKANLDNLKRNFE